MRSVNGTDSKSFVKYYGKYKYKKIYLKKITVFPINGISYKSAMNFQQDICNYTELGRMKVHDNVKDVNIYTLRYLMNHPIESETVEYNDNRISLYVGQKGKCYISGTELEIGYMEAHHIIPKILGGSDKYENLVFVHKYIHKIIHATKTETIEKYSKQLNLGEKELKKLNKLRKTVGNHELNKIDL